MNKTDNEQKEIPVKNRFRLRGIETTRLHTFMDAAFAFAITMLVISIGEIPKDYSELIISLKEIPAFLCSFFIIMIFWLNHRSWSRRYGLEDNITIFLSISLIFILLVFLYPLRLMFSSLFTWLSNGWFPSSFVLHTRTELIGLFAIYGVGLFAISGIISLLYFRSYLKRISLQLNEFEIHNTKLEVLSLSLVSITGLTAAVLALLLPENIALLSGFVYVSIPINIALINHFYKKQWKESL